MNPLWTVLGVEVSCAKAGRSMKERVLASIEQREGYLVVRVYSQQDDQLELIASCAGQREHVERLLSRPGGNIPSGLGGSGPGPDCPGPGGRTSGPAGAGLPK